MNTFTAGPWSINVWQQKDADICIGSAGTPLIARIALRDVSINEQRANANLIAAAPKLLAALEAMMDAFQLARRDGSAFKAYEDAHAAVDDARGVGK